MRPTRWLSMAAAAALLLAGCSPGPTGTSQGASQGAATGAPSARPSPTASAPPPTVAAAPCVTTVTSLPEDPAAEPARLVDVGLDARGEVDRIEFAFAGDAAPAFDVSPAEPPFVADASGLPVVVPGAAFLRIRFPFATGMDTYDGPATLVGSGSGVVALVRTGDFEAILTWVVGTAAASCVRVDTSTAPGRVILDVEPAG